MPPRKTTARTPKATRMTTPGYGFDAGKSSPGRKMPWRHVEKLIAGARNYWICTTRPGGRPHSAPVWGVWLDGTLWFSTGDTSVKGRNIAANPDVVVVPELNNEAVIIEGRARSLKSPAKLQPVWKAYNKKYDWKVEGYPFYEVSPRVMFSFKEDLAETATKWEFGRARR